MEFLPRLAVDIFKTKLDVVLDVRHSTYKMQNEKPGWATFSVLVSKHCITFNHNRFMYNK